MSAETKAESGKPKTVIPQDHIVPLAADALRIAGGVTSACAMQTARELEPAEQQQLAELARQTRDLADAIMDAHRKRREEAAIAAAKQ